MAHQPRTATCSHLIGDVADEKLLLGNDKQELDDEDIDDDEKLDGKDINDDEELDDVDDIR